MSCPVLPSDSDMVTAVAWAPDNQLVSCSDDKTLCKWSADGEHAGNKISVDIFISHISWFPTVGKQVTYLTSTYSPPLSHARINIPFVPPQSADMFAAACTDGTFRFFTRSGREEKKIKAHEGECVAAALLATQLPTYIMLTFLSSRAVPCHVMPWRGRRCGDLGGVEPRWVHAALGGRRWRGQDLVAQVSLLFCCIECSQQCCTVQRCVLRVHLSMYGHMSVCYCLPDAVSPCSACRFNSLTF